MLYYLALAGLLVSLFALFLTLMSFLPITWLTAFLMSAGLTALAFILLDVLE